MQIGSKTGSVFQLLKSQTGKSATNTNGFQEQLAQSNFDRTDTNRDGYVDRSEFVTDKMKLRGDGFQPRLEDVLNDWNRFDADGKGHLSEDEFKSRFSSVLTVSMGRITNTLR
ncbi:MAG: EF-hand domain-containing protein [Rhodobacteraceae bacterium]|nr:EF-hand domain-containing protein [Paracoccaceae bacterium]